MSVFRDPWLLVIDKAHGVDTQVLYQSLRAEHAYVGLHHRLDQPASGLVLFTLHEAANAAIAKGFREHEIVREYVAVLVGEAESEVWEWPLAQKTARTHVEVLAVANGMSAVRCHLETGRTHQIRQHGAMAGTPIAGDRRYGAEAGRAWPRLALHASRLRLDHPVTGEKLELTCPVPEDLSALWALAGGSGS